MTEEYRKSGNFESEEEDRNLLLTMGDALLMILTGEDPENEKDHVARRLAEALEAFQLRFFPPDEPCDEESSSDA